MYWLLSLLVLLLIVLLCLYGKPPVQYYAKYVVYGLLYTLWAVITLPVYIVRPFDNRNVSDYWRLWTSPAIPLGLKFRIKGKEHITDTRSVLIMLNHQSAIDVIVYSRLMNVIGRCSPIAKKAVAFMGIWGLLTYLGDGILINRSSGRNAMQTIREQMNRMKQTKSKILFFPEGTRNDDGSLLPFKAGGFRIAIENNLPILPMVISPYYFINNKKKIFDSGRIIVQVLPEISTTGLTVNDVDELRNKVRDTMVETFEQLKQDIAIESAEAPSTWSNMFSYDF